MQFSEAIVHFNLNNFLAESNASLLLGAMVENPGFLPFLSQPGERLLDREELRHLHTLGQLLLDDLNVSVDGLPVDVQSVLAMASGPTPRTQYWQTRSRRLLMAARLLPFFLANLKTSHKFAYFEARVGHGFLACETSSTWPRSGRNSVAPSP